MKILMINKFLYPNGGSETYIFKLGQELERQGHEVQYFGMEHPDNCVGNAAGSYTSNMDFHAGGLREKLSYGVKTIYSAEARKKIRLVLDTFQPDVCHLNNFNYQLTPSVILEIRKWEKDTGHRVKILFTAHDGQLVCPNHMMRNPNTGAICEKCLYGSPWNCIRGRCIHGSLAKSAIGTMESLFWKWMGVYRQIDTIICPTHFMKAKLDCNPLLARKTVVMHNFVEPVLQRETAKKDYVLYFGRYSEEKGIRTLLSVCRELPQVQFVFAGSGPLEGELNGIANVRNVGFQRGEDLAQLIREARFSVYPSEVYENCPFSVLESQMYGTPVLGADIGGIPELITVGRTGELFDSGNADMLWCQILKLWQDRQLTEAYSRNCMDIGIITAQQYYEKLLMIYQQGEQEWQRKN